MDLANSVAGIKVVDPACGSGAFLLGMLQEILNLNDTLFRAGKTPESLYQQKLDIITNNIYGADNDGLAVSTAMLRLWLSLAVDYEGEGIPDPLPNLDMKLAVGDSIAGPNPQQLDLTIQSITNSNLRGEIAEYTTAQGQRKSELRRGIEDTKQQLRDRMGDAAHAGVVEWRIEFADVMLNGGFHVVIANPPYVQLQANGGELADLYKSTGFETFARTGDIYQLFYERGCQLAHKDHGILAYITSNSWLKAEYGKALRRYFSEKNTPLLLMELGKDVFDSAIVDSCILILQAGGASQAFPAVDTDRAITSEFPPSLELWGQVRPNGDMPWSILSPIEQSIFYKMQRRGIRLKDWDVKINFGIKTGYNNAFIIDDETKQELVSKDPDSGEIIVPVLRGKDIRRFHSPWAGKWLIDTHNGYGHTPAIDIANYPLVKTHLDKHYPQLEKRKDKGKTPYNLRNCAYHENFKEEKLLWIELVDEGRFSYDNSGILGEATTFMMTGKSLKFLCAVLNSRLIRWFLQQTAPTSGMGTLRWKKAYVENIPIPTLSEEGQHSFVQLVDSILESKSSDPKNDTTETETRIEELVYQAFGLTIEEVSAIDDRL